MCPLFEEGVQKLSRNNAPQFDVQNNVTPRQPKCTHNGFLLQYKMIACVTLDQKALYVHILHGEK